jgi:hypothetical protein
VNGSRDTMKVQVGPEIKRERERERQVDKSEESDILEKGMERGGGG